MGRIPSPPPPRNQAELESQIAELERDIFDLRGRTIGARVMLAGVILLGIALAGCQSLVNIPPGTFPTPPPDTPPMNPSPICEPPGLVANCYVKRPGEPWSYLCADGITNPPGPSECPSGPPVTACTIPDQGAVRVEPVPPPDPAVVAAVNAAARKVAGCAEGPPSRCVVLRPMREFLADVAAELRAGGRCAGVQDNGHADEVCAETAPGRCQGVHVFACAADCSRGTVAWAPGSVRDVWSGVGQGPTPEPTPVPKPGDPPSDETTCDPGTPDATHYTFGGWPLPRNPSQRFVFVSAKVRDSVYCPKHNDDPRAQGSCPFWPEGHPKRADCERKHGLPVWFGAAVRADNPFSADAAAGATVTVCLKSSCSDPAKQETCRTCSTEMLP